MTHNVEPEALEDAAHERRLCACDGYGLTVNERGTIVRCPHCGGRRLTNVEVKEVRRAAVA